MPSTKLPRGSWVLMVTRVERAASRTRSCLRAISSRLSIAAHWKGVWGLGTWLEALATTFTRRFEW